MPSCLHSSAFTLTELLVAIALLAIIMAIVTTIFRTTGQTVATGIALTDQNRALAAAGQQLQQDIIGYSDADPYVQGSGMWPVNEAPGPSAPPFLFIRNYSQNSYRDQAAFDAHTTEGFRLDSMGFFTRGAFKRQTGTITPTNVQLVDNMPVFTRAYVWYGHLRLTGGTDQNPGQGGAGSNPNNFYANQWILGRRAVLLTDVIPAPSTAVGTVVDYNGHPVRFYGRDDNPLTRNDPTNFAPLGRAGQATLIDTGPFVTSQQITESRYDIAAMNRDQTWQDYATLLQTYQTRYQAGTFGAAYATPWVERNDAFVVRHLASPIESIDIDWSKLDDTTNRGAFADAAALAVPVLLRNCTNFAVEFAGDYVAQNPANGAVLSSASFDVNDPSTWHLDGVIDYDLVGGRQQIHWYGMPRDTSGDGLIRLYEGDVTTVSQMRAGSLTPATTLMPFELANAAGLYTCGWTRDMLCLPGTAAISSPLSLAPKLIRITVQVTDPQGRVLEDMTRQYVFPVKYN